MKDDRMKHALENIARRGVPEDTNLMPQIAAKLERKTFMTTLRTRPLVATLLAFLILLLMSGAAYAIGRSFGYIPGVGLVENESGMRVLAEPASVTRDGVTLTVTEALVYPDHVQLIYEASGIAPEDNSAFFTDPSYDQSAFCGGVKAGDPPNTDGDARLRLPDGTMVERVFGSDKYPENIFATKPAYEVSIPADVTELTMVLKCIPWARLGAVPEDWEVPLKLKSVPAGTVIGQPVLEVTPSDTSSTHDKTLTVSLDKVVPQDDLYSFYLSIVPDEKKDSMLALYPYSAYLVDATKQKTALVYNHPFSGSHEASEPWELQSVSKPAYGPYTVVLEKVLVYHQELGDQFFEFDAGATPQVGQTWEINQTLDLNGTDVKVTTARMVEQDLSMWGLSTNTQGMEFTFEAVDGETPFQLDIMDRDLDHINAGMIVPFSVSGMPSTSATIALYYEKGVPAGPIAVAMNGQSTMLTGHWELQWTSPDQTGVTLLDSTQAIPAQNNMDVTSSLERVVKLDDGYLFYIDMRARNANPDLRVIEPGVVSVIDSTGRKVTLQLNGPQTHMATTDTIWEFSTTESLAGGPLKVMIEKAKMYYDAWDSSVPPSAEMIAAHAFTFDAGEDPQLDQTWALDHDFELGGYRGKIISVRTVPVDSQLLSFPELRPDGSINRGYEFTIQSDDPAIQWNVSVFIDRPQDSIETFVDCIGYIPGEPASLTTHTVTCRGLFGQTLRVTIYEVAVQLDGMWEMNWNLPVQ